ncbi:MAG: S9 family peptidase, partial [Bacteroidota bacterium]
AWPTERPERAEGDAARATPNPDGTLAEIRAWLDQNRQDASPRVLTRLDFQGELDLSPTDSYRHLFVMEATPGATPVRITDGFYSHGGETWLANGEQIVFSAALDPNQHPDRVEDGNLYLIDPDGQNLRLLLDLEGYTLFDPQLMPEGQTLAFRAVRQADRGFAQTEIGLYDLSGQFPPELLTGSFDRSVSSMAWAPNGRYLYFSAPANGGFPLYRLRPFDGVEAAAEAAPPDNATRPSRRETLLMRTPEVERLTSLERGVRSFGVGPATIFYVMTEVANPYELYASNVAFSNERRLTDHNAGWLATKRLSVPESYTVEHDGFETQYWIMRPTFYEEGQRYPLLLEIHGGPSAMWGPGEVSMWHEFQFFASRGYGIVYSNPRGSGGYGTDFRRGNYQDWGVGPAGDVLAAATEAAREPWVDPRRQVVTGGSYAGYLTAWILTQDTRFQAAAAQRGVYDLATFMGEGNAWRLVPNHFGGYPWDDEPADTAEVSIRTILERNSPQTYVDQIQTPFLIMHGDLDLRTGVIQSEVLYKSLKILERPVEYVRYPGEGHELSRSGDPRLRMDRILRIYEFFGRYVE